MGEGSWASPIQPQKWVLSGCQEETQKLLLLGESFTIASQLRLLPTSHSPIIGRGEGGDISLPWNTTLFLPCRYLLSGTSERSGLSEHLCACGKSDQTNISSDTSSYLPISIHQPIVTSPRTIWRKRDAGERPLHHLVLERLGFPNSVAEHRGPQVLNSGSYSRSSFSLSSPIKCPPDWRPPRCPMLVTSAALPKLEDKYGFLYWENSVSPDRFPNPNSREQTYDSPRWSAQW